MWSSSTDAPDAAQTGKAGLKNASSFSFAWNCRTRPTRTTNQSHTKMNSTDPQKDNFRSASDSDGILDWLAPLIWTPILIVVGFFITLITFPVLLIAKIIKSFR